MTQASIRTVRGLLHKKARLNILVRLVERGFHCPPPLKMISLSHRNVSGVCFACMRVRGMFYRLLRIVLLQFVPEWTSVPECSRCAEVCPTGALGKPIEVQEKLKRRSGLAILSPDRCLATNGVKCNSCLRHCPVNAIKHDDKGLPLVDEAKCIGCGSCEYHCPVRPTVAIHVEGKI